MSQLDEQNPGTGTDQVDGIRLEDHWTSQPGGATPPAFLPALVGRDEELALIGSFVRDVTMRGGALLLSGEPGVGKSVLLDAAAAQAHVAGAFVLRAAGAQFESDVSFAVLSQLFQPLLDASAQDSELGPVLAALSPLHATALRIALGWQYGPPASRLALSNAVLALIRHLAADRPVFMVLDDLHWADQASATLLSSLARQLAGSNAGFIGAARFGERSFFDQAEIPSHEVSPLSESDAMALLSRRFPGIAAPVLHRMLAEAHGNPLALLELPLALSSDQRRAHTALPGILPLTARLQSLFTSRLARLPGPSRELLLRAALDGTNELGVLEEAAQRSADSLLDAEWAQLVRFDQPGGRPVFRHPLVRSAVVELATIDDRRRAHRALADLAERAARPDQQAKHLAAAVTAPDEMVASTLEIAACHALRESDPAGAVRALLRAADLSPNQADGGRRMAEAAYVGAAVAGDLRDAVRLIDAAHQAAPGGSLEAAMSKAQVLLHDDGKLRAAYRVLTAAIDAVLDSAGADGMAAPAEEIVSEAMRLLMVICWCGGRAELWQAYHRMVARMRPCPPRLVLLEAALGADPARATAAELADLDMCVSALREETHPTTIARVAQIALYVDRTADCRDALWRLVRNARAGGAVAPGISALALLADDDFREGVWSRAQQVTDEGAVLCETYGYHLLGSLHSYIQALLAAGRGDDQAVRALTIAVTRWATPRGARNLIRAVAHARALSAIGRSDFEEAYRQASAISPPGTFSSHTPYALRVPLELVEAAVRTGRQAEASAHVQAMQAAGLPSISPRLALLTAGAAAIACPHDASFQAALASPGAHRSPFELARIQLAYGEHLRRSRARAKARIQLTAALEAFQRLGAAPWAARAASELRACGLTAAPSTGETLSPREREIAALAAVGLTNKQIGKQLYLSPRTVGDHLHKIFPKLGITTRAALRDALAELPSPGPADRNKLNPYLV